MSSQMELEPKMVFHYFNEISKIPRGSGSTREISSYLTAFAKEHGLRFIQDAEDNVVIWKNASPGYEKSEPVILQGHIDMVCEKKIDSIHDFMKDGLDLETDGDFLFAKDTTLGADNGIAVAYMLAILSDPHSLHPPLEAVFTSDEEIGLLGAAALDASLLKGRRMINLDSEEEGIFLTGCAGGQRFNSFLPVVRTKKNGLLYSLSVEGLIGGHSGSEIHRGRGNSNVLMGRLLYRLSKVISYSLYTLTGDGKDNAIPRKTDAQILIHPQDADKLTALTAELNETYKNEFRSSDPDVHIYINEKGEETKEVLTDESLERVIFFIVQAPSGVQRMSADVEGLVETSLNMGILKLEDKEIMFSYAVRSSIESSKSELSDRLIYLTEYLGGHYSTTGNYPGWQYRKDSPLRLTMIKVYQNMYHKEPVVEAIHAGLECGVFISKIAGLDCISMGPDMYDVHTTEERLCISSAGRVYEYLQEVLKNL